MSHKVFTTTPGTPLESACKIMVRNGLRRIPIVGGEADISKAAKKLLGIITSTDVIRFLNAKELFEMSDIDGGLVGGASLEPEEFSKIVNF